MRSSSRRSQGAACYALSDGISASISPLSTTMFLACCAAVRLVQLNSSEKENFEPSKGAQSKRSSGSKNGVIAFDWGGFDSPGPRDEMEDSWCMISLSRKVLYFGVFDGHGGSASSTYLKSNLITFIEDAGMKMCDSAANGELLDEYGVGDENPLAQAFEKADSALIDYLGSLGDPECWSGSTATTCFVSRGHIIVANVGDSRAVLGRKGQTVDLSGDHRPVGSSKTGRTEILRVLECGGWVSKMRVCGILAVTRAFGDYEFKGGRAELLQELVSTGSTRTETLTRAPIVAIPDVKVYKRSDEDDFIILATDGLWDVMNSAQAITFVRTMVKQDSTCSMQDISSALIERALKSRTHDNVSCVVIDIRSMVT